jgi:hypothetical protein
LLDLIAPLGGTLKPCASKVSLRSCKPEQGGFHLGGGADRDFRRHRLRYGYDGIYGYDYLCDLSWQIDHPGRRNWLFSDGAY